MARLDESPDACDITVFRSEMQLVIHEASRFGSRPFELLRGKGAANICRLERAWP